MPRVLADLERKKSKQVGKSTGDSDVDDDDTDEEGSNAMKRDDFVQDPAMLREQAAQRRISQAMRGRRGGAPPRSYDVKGGPKGQGQSKEVVHNRRMKDKFKGKGQKAGADKKMSKGMF